MRDMVVIPHKQRGLSFTGWIAVLAVVGAVATTGVRIVPHYLTFNTVREVVGSLPATQVHSMGKTEIRESLKKRFKINSIRTLKVDDIISVERRKGATRVAVDYEVREHLVANLSVVIHFKRDYDFE